MNSTSRNASRNPVASGILAAMYGSDLLLFAKKQLKNFIWVTLTPFLDSLLISAAP